MRWIDNMTLHHWFQVRAWDWKGVHCLKCPCKWKYADCGREATHPYCDWIDDAGLEKKEAERFLRQHLLNEPIP